MGVLYCKSCQHCDTRQNITFAGFVAAVITNRDACGDIIPEDYLAFLRSDHDLVVLPHPLEASSLKGAGGSWNNAVRNGRILRFVNLVCTDCGTINTTAQVHSGGLGCFTGLIAAILAVGANVWLLQLHWTLEFGVVWLALCAPGLACDVYVRRRHANSAAPYQFVGCTNCGGDAAIPLSAAKSRKLPCAKCGQNSVTISYAGKS